VNQSETGPGVTGAEDPDADPGMKTSGAEQPDQAEGEDEAAETDGSH
jgi:hypothetical protein